MEVAAVGSLGLAVGLVHPDVGGGDGEQSLEGGRVVCAEGMVGLLTAAGGGVPEYDRVPLGFESTRAGEGPGVTGKSAQHERNPEAWREAAEQHSKETRDAVGRHVLGGAATTVGEDRFSFVGRERLAHRGEQANEPGLGDHPFRRLRLETGPSSHHLGAARHLVEGAERLDDRIGSDPGKLTSGHRRV